jgi:hypothetical protein
LYELVEHLGEAAAKQAAARGLELPEFYSDDAALRKELLARINESLAGINNRYLVEIGEGGIVGKHPGNKGGIVQGLPAGQVQVISQITALEAADLMPATPPLVGDSLYGRLDIQYRRKMYDFLGASDRHALLFLTPAELDGLEEDPQYELALDEESSNFRITHVR